MRHLLSLALHHDQDVVTARTRAAQLGQMLGFDPSEQTRVATAVSEIVRNAFRYASGGSVTFAVDDEVPASRRSTTSSRADTSPVREWGWESSGHAG
jgi:two-component sensor histidine kinase